MKLGYIPHELLLLSVVLLIGCRSGSKQDSAEVSESSKNPNILFIYLDDMGYGDPQCYNPESLIPTPNINRLAKEGMKFTDAHTAAAICGPSRYGLLTGCYPWRRGKGGIGNGKKRARSAVMLAWMSSSNTQDVNKPVLWPRCSMV
jgi:hypothetical protein